VAIAAAQMAVIDLRQIVILGQGVQWSILPVDRASWLWGDQKAGATAWIQQS
jgi:hypothetical protein